MADEVNSAPGGGKAGPGAGPHGGTTQSPANVPTTSPVGPPADSAADFSRLLSDAALGARRLQAAAGMALYEADAPARHLFYIHEGQVRIFQVGPRQSAQLVEILGPGDWFGVPALARPAAPADGAPREARYGMRAVAVTAVDVSEVPAERLLAALPDQPAVARELIAQLAAKLQAAYGHAANLVFDDTEKRLIKALLQFSRTAAATPATPAEAPAGQPGAQGSAAPGGGVVLRITHQQLAQAVGAARETVSLTLTQLRQRNLLSTGRNRLSFDPRVLEEFARRSEAGGEAEAGQGAAEGGAGDSGA